MVQEIYLFLKEQYYLPLYLVTWIVSVFTYRKYFDTALKYFPMFIAYTFFTELLGYFIKYHEDFQFFSDERYSWRNIIIYNIYQVVTFLFFCRIYLKTIQSKLYKKWIRYGVIAMLLGYIINIIFKNPFYEGLYYADIFGSWVLLMCIIFYFKEKKQEKNPYPQKQNLLFWISLGSFIFYLLVPYILLIGNTSANLWFYLHLRTVLLLLILVMYSCFIIGFLVGKRKAFR
ncbi:MULTISPECIES: hypothetical protein [Flavobacteriaceae]|uniref:Uncharacterized protein n=1 Tax=Flagellimonas alvinocaridis TaxID=2530200 RepID=A0A4S8RXN9_9FLAO|nr:MULTISPECIES: hypothetical protein [Allomuricauda]MDC6362600.1 hypothetical protein [Muricauda sp. SP22]THV60149.1 hypothetical protein EZV76_06200 [Allomuricauda alvinocaridis]